MATTSKSALITGGASGMGLEVAKALARRGGWELHLLDVNAERGQQAAAEVEHATFHQVNVLDYDSLANIFQQVYDTQGRLDFVFANAGIVERFNFYEPHPAGKPPPPPDQTVIDINLKSVVNTVWLAQHYFRQSTISDDKNLIITSSVGGFYRTLVTPPYCASKHGVLGLMRSIAPFFYKHVGVRVNAICPSMVKTNLLDSSAWDSLDKNLFVPLEKISQTVLMLIDGHDVGGKHVGSELNGIPDTTKSEKMYGQAVEISGTDHYYREQLPFSSPEQEAAMKNLERETFV